MLRELEKFMDQSLRKNETTLWTGTIRGSQCLKEAKNSLSSQCLKERKTDEADHYKKVTVHERVKNQN